MLPAESGLHSEGLQHTAGGSLLQEADHRKSLENLKGKVQAQQEGQVPGRKNLELNVQRNTLHSEQVVFGSRQNAGVGSQVPGGNTNCLKKKPDRMVILGAATVARLMNGPNLRLGNPDEGTDTSRKNKSIIPPLERGPREMMEALMLVEDAITTLSENGARENVGKNEVLAHLCNKKLGRDPNVIRVLDDKFSNSSNIRKWTSTKAIQGARLLGKAQSARSSFNLSEHQFA